jgi:RNA polymerase sigma factor (sigma-70 family)
MDELLCVQQVLSGNTSAFAYFVETYQDMAMTIALRICGNRQDAEDIVQESYLKAFRNLHSFRSDSKFSTWLYRIVYNTAVTHTHARIWTTDYGKEAEEVPALSDDNPELQMEEAEKKEMVSKILDQMATGDALLLTLYYMEDHSVKEVAQMHLEQKDTTLALADYNKAIEIDPYTSQSFASRGLLYYQLKEYNKALADLDEAIRLDPYFEGNYINRGLVKYSLNDLRGAMADYDRVLEMDANNLIARFNRGLLRAQVGDNNRAIEDFDKVLELEPGNTIAYLNRALLNNEINNYEGALADLNVVLREHPDFFQGYYMRSELKRKMGDLAGAEKDFYLARNEEAEFGKKSENETNPAKLDKDTQPKETRETTDNDIEKFNMLVVADKETEQKTNYRNRSRGKVQNINARVELQPKFVLTYYEKPYEVQRPVYFLKELDKANHESGLAWKLRITNNEAGLNELQIQTHFRSINNYSKQIDNEPNKPMLYFGRGLDYMLVQDYANALQDINTTISLKPDMTIAYFARAVIRSKQMEVDAMAQQQDGLKGGDSPLKIKLPSRNEKFTGQNLPKVPEVSKEIIGYDAILKDYEKILQLDPDFFYAYYNRAEIYTIEKDYRAAINDYTEAIKREPNFAEAYFNRGLARLSIGESTAGLDDLRKAGELGIVESYSIIKRMQ